MYQVTIYDGHEDETGTVIHSPYPNEVKLSSGSINIVLQGISDMSLAINPMNTGWGKINPLRTLIKVVNLKTNKIIFDGRILKPTQKMSSDGMFSIEYACESKLAYLNDSNQRHGEYHDITVKEFFEVMINNHNKQVEPHKQIKVGNVTVTNSTDNVYRYLGYEKTYVTIKDKLIDRLGGFLVLRDEPDGMYLDYLESVGEFKDTPIRLRTNLKDMQRDIDPLDVITRLVPLGASIESEDESATDASQARVTIESVNNGVDYLDDLELQDEFGVIGGSVTYDDVNNPGILKTRGNQYLASQKAAKVSYDVTPVDVSLIDSSFETFECGNWHQIINPVFAADEPLQIIEQKIDINNPQNASLTIGEKYKTLTQYQVEANKKANSIVELEQTVSRQSQTIGNLKTELVNVNDAVSTIELTLKESDLPALESAITDLQDAINNLNEAIDSVPIYEVATQAEDGLMSSVDKIKLDGIQDATTTTSGLMPSADKSKLNLISVTNNVDLDSVLARLAALENV